MKARGSGAQGKGGDHWTLTLALLVVLGPACGGKESGGEPSAGGAGAVSGSGGAIGGLAGSVNGGTTSGGTPASGGATSGGTSPGGSGSGGASGVGGEAGGSPIRVPQRYLDSQPGPGAGMCGCELGEECALTFSGVGETEYGCFSIPSECATSFGCDECFTPCRVGEACAYAPGSGQYRCMGA